MHEGSRHNVNALGVRLGQGYDYGSAQKKQYVSTTEFGD